jgi:hypothetical protein
MAEQQQQTQQRQVHLLVADLTRTACGMPANPAMNTTTIADRATCDRCKMQARS